MEQQCPSQQNNTRRVWFISQPLKTATKKALCDGNREPNRKKRQVYLHLWEPQASVPFVLSGLQDREVWRRRDESAEPSLYLLSCPGPSHPGRTECHLLRPVTSHSQSLDFPEPDPWSAAFLWGCPPLTLEEEDRGAFGFPFKTTINTK